MLTKSASLDLLCQIRRLMGAAEGRALSMEEIWVLQTATRVLATALEDDEWAMCHVDALEDALREECRNPSLARRGRREIFVLNSLALSGYILGL